MNALARAAIAGSSGALATNVAHEIVRRIVPSAPRIDLLGMQSLAKAYRATGAESPVGRELYVQTLIGDLISNSAYFALVALGGPASLPLGLGLGLVAGLGAVLVPEKTDLDEGTTGRTTQTKLLTTALYLLGGAVSGSVFGALGNEGESE